MRLLRSLNECRGSITCVSWKTDRVLTSPRLPPRTFPRLLVISLGPPPPLLSVCVREERERQRWLRTEPDPGSAIWAIAVPEEATAAVLRPVLSLEGARAGLPLSP